MALSIFLLGERLNVLLDQLTSAMLRRDDLSTEEVEAALRRLELRGREISDLLRVAADSEDALVQLVMLEVRLEAELHVVVAALHNVSNEKQSKGVLRT